VVPVHLHTVLLSAQHDPGISQAELQSALMTHVVDPVIDAHRWPSACFGASVFRARGVWSAVP
jgi:S-adenosylmethionine synthetase